MATKEKSKKTETTKRGRKKGRKIAGSPVTIGGGAGLAQGQVYIQVTPGYWKWDPENGMLTPTEEGDTIDRIDIYDVVITRSIRVRENHGYYRPLQHDDVHDMKIDLD